MSVFSAIVVYKDNLVASTQDVIEAETPQLALAEVIESSLEEMYASKIVLEAAEEGNMWILDHEDQMIIIQQLQ